MTCHIKATIRQRKREFDRHGKSKKWKALYAKTKQLTQNAKNSYAENVVNRLKNCNKSSWYSEIKRLGSASGDITGGTFEILEHTEKPDDQVCEEIADFFSAISQEYPPLDRSLLPENLNHISFPTNAPILEEYETYNLLKNIKLTKSAVPGDIPHKILKEFGIEFSTPLTEIFNASMQQGIFPTNYKKEFQVPIPKIPSPNDFDELRNLSCTMVFSKRLEKIMLDHLLKHTRPYIDPTHYGGFKGSSTVHYLINLLDFAHKNLDKPDITAVIMCLIDWSKAFNRMNHNITMKRLIEYEVPEWLLKMTASYLEHRSMQVRYRGHVSTPRELPSSSPQGTLLGLLLFIITSNETCMTFDPLPEKIITRENSELVNQDDNENLCRAKFVDDVAMAEAVEKIKLTPKTCQRIVGPLPFNDSSNLELSPNDSLLQKEIVKAKHTSDELQMILNSDKTKVFVVNYTHNYQFQPRLRVPGSTTDLEVVSSTKLVGVTLTSDLKFHKHVHNIVQKANKKLWMLRRLKQYSICEEDLIEVYIIFIRCYLEYCVPVWNASLTDEDKDEIERIQKTALKIILGEGYGGYQTALEMCDLLSLEERREELCLNFALKSSTDVNHKKLFTPTENPLLHYPPKYQPPFCLHERYRNSPLPYLTDLLNKFHADRPNETE